MTLRPKIRPPAPLHDRFAGGNFTRRAARERPPNLRNENKDYVQDYLRLYGARKVEANALVSRPAAGRQLCREAITKYIDQSGIVRYTSKLKQERARVRGVLPSVLRDLTKRLKK